MSFCSWSTFRELSMMTNVLKWSLNCQKSLYWDLWNLWPNISLIILWKLLRKIVGFPLNKVSKFVRNIMYTTAWSTSTKEWEISWNQFALLRSESTAFSKVETTTTRKTLLLTSKSNKFWITLSMCARKTIHRKFGNLYLTLPLNYTTSTKILTCQRTKWRSFSS
jgi:hypothetical protein